MKLFVFTIQTIRGLFAPKQRSKRRQERRVCVQAVQLGPS